MTELPLEEQVLNTTPGSNEVLSGIQPDSIINGIRENWEQDLQALLGTTRPVQLDLAQAESLLTGLAKRLSIIQGPPGLSPLSTRLDLAIFSRENPVAIKRCHALKHRG